MGKLYNSFLFPMFFVLCNFLDIFGRVASVYSLYSSNARKKETDLEAIHEH